MPGFPSAIRVFALTHSRRIVFQREPWLISFSLDLTTMREFLERLRTMNERYETPLAIRHVESHLIFGLLARHAPIGLIALLGAAFTVGNDLYQQRFAPGVRIASVVWDVFIWGGLMLLFNLSMTRRQQAILAWSATKFTLAIAAFIMIFVGAGSAFREGDIRDGLVFLFLGLLWFPSIEFIPSVTPHQKYVTLARLVLSIPLVIIGIQGGNWHWNT